MTVPDNFEKVDFKSVKGGIAYDDVAANDVEMFLIRAPADFDPSALSGASFSLESGGVLHVDTQAADADPKKRKKKGRADQNAVDEFVLEPIASQGDGRSGLTEYSSFGTLLRASDGTLRMGKGFKGQINIVRRLSVPNVGKPMYVRTPVKQRTGLVQRWTPYGSRKPFKASPVASQPNTASQASPKKRKRADAEPDAEESAPVEAHVPSQAAQSAEPAAKSEHKKRKRDVVEAAPEAATPDAPTVKAHKGKGKAQSEDAAATNAVQAEQTKPKKATRGDVEKADVPVAPTADIAVAETKKKSSKVKAAADVSVAVLPVVEATAATAKPKKSKDKPREDIGAAAVIKGDAASDPSAPVAAEPSKGKAKKSKVGDEPAAVADSADKKPKPKKVK